MALIRQASARDLTRDAIVLDLGDLQRQATGIIASARAEAERIIVHARAEHERIVAGAAAKGRVEGFEVGEGAGRAAGIEQGRAAALVEFKERLGELDQAWTGAIENFEGRREELLRAAQTDVLRLAVGIAERITKRTIELDPQVAAAQLEAVLAVIVRPTRLVVRINPADRGVVEAALPQLAARLVQARHVELVDDAALGRGSCVAATREQALDAASGAALCGGEIDASIQMQMDRIVEALLPQEPDAGASYGAGGGNQS